MSVNRYDPEDWGGLHMVPKPDGDWVCYEAWEHVNRQIAALKEENERLKAGEASVRDALDGYDNHAEPAHEIVKSIRHRHDSCVDTICDLKARVAELEPVEVVAVVTLGGIFHGGSGPELGDIDIEPSMSALEGIQLAAVHSDEDVHLDLMTVTQHERIVAAMAGQIDWQNITD